MPEARSYVVYIRGTALGLDALLEGRGRGGQKGVVSRMKHSVVCCTYVHGATAQAGLVFLPFGPGGASGPSHSEYRDVEQGASATGELLLATMDVAERLAFRRASGWWPTESGSVKSMVQHGTLIL